MLKAIILFTVFTSTSVWASRSDKGDSKITYIEVETGKQLSAIEADRATTMDKAVVSCRPVEKVCNERTGKCTIKNVK